MCGIAGIIRLRPDINIKSDIEQMSGSLAHRGPDDQGYFIRDNIALSHRRLSIIDLATGLQPMSSIDQKIWIVYNGEIYNFLEIKSILISKNYSFRTTSDTEVIINSYIEWGENCVEKFRGMFAFSIVDYRIGKIFLARDHMGMKPLFFAHTPDFFAFASELQAFKHIHDFTPKININSIDKYLRLQYIPAPDTIFKEIKKMKPAHRLSISFEGKISEQDEYWKLNFLPQNNKTKEDWVAEAEYVIKDSVKSHLISDVPFGAFLSGGIDSSLVVSYMTQILNKPVKTFSIGFEESSFNELEYASIVSNKWNTEHYSEVVKPNVLGILPELVRHFGEPFGDSSAIPTYYVSKMARKKVPMVLSGDGGDELFAGYQSYKNWMQLTDKNYPFWKKMMYPFAHKIYPHRFPSRKHELESWLDIISYFHTKQRSKLWKREWHLNLDNSMDLFEYEYLRAKEFSDLSKVQYLDLKTYLPNDILVKVDTSSMIHGLESRSPLVDYKVAEFAATVPSSIYVGSNPNELINGKFILKEILKKNFPENFINRKKMGFGVPVKNWVSSESIWIETMNEKLLSRDSLLNQFFNHQYIKYIIN
ncbi:MAG: asparagine synthase (glutamine-hydrolyzing), partial [Bacteroidales bacterium]|nr:asparagine synthase (glutamine-hydrolyzing) [Bacteroidales bacterium]